MGIVMFVLRWALLALAVVLAAWVTPDVDFSGGPLSALVVAALVAAANVVAQHVLRGGSPPRSTCWSSRQ